jgi:bifunctional pyridoxal-dependent enzyme with beta-cystathionase and maltose regulon repressor activities
MIFDAISTFDQLDDLSTKYSDIYGVEPFNLSFWDPSEEFKEKMCPYLKIEYPKNPINYIFTYQIEDIKNRLLESLGFDSKIKDGILTPNGTTSIMMAVHWLKMKGFKKLNVVRPAYFSLTNNCQKENIECVKYDMDYRTGQINGISPNNFKDEIFWITNPFYSLGHYINEDSIKLIEKLLERNTVIVDDCLAQKNKELSRYLGNHPNFIGIYAPHKSVCVNGLKFSILVFDKEDEPFFDQSIDFLCGGINVASLAAIQNYLDGSYDLYRKKLQENMEPTHQFIGDLCTKIPGAYYENKDLHYLTGICFPQIPYELGLNKDFIWKIMDNTGAAFISGAFNNYPKETGFSFRVNLTRDSAIFRATLTRLLLFLKDISS